MSGRGNGVSMARVNGRVLLRGLDGAGARAVAAAMIDAGACVEIEPHPCDEWVASFKDEGGLADVAMSAVAPRGESVTAAPRLFRVTVVRTGTGERSVEVMACSAGEAEALALEDAGDHEYREHSAEYSATATAV
jgi:hypothetical protein